MRENAQLLTLWLDRLRSGGDVNAIVQTVDEYARIYKTHTGRNLHDAAIFEIGFGARPLRMMALHGFGFDASGVDLETPMLRFGPATFLQIGRTNGFERAVKSAVRSLFFDRLERRSLNNRMAQRGAHPLLMSERLIVADASDLDLPEGSLDLIVSEDVFEHIRPEALQRLVPKMASWLRPDGLALIRPMVYTGICGSHLIDWYPHRVIAGRLPRDTEPWEHLRQKRARAGTYLNECTRADYRALFATSFVVVDERVRHPHLGRQFLNPQIVSELSEWPEDELFSNAVQFVLRPVHAPERPERSPPRLG